jgi:flagellar protein FliS
MMHPGTAANQYLRTQVKSSQPLELVVMMYDAALRFTATAREAMIKGDIPTRRTAISKAMAIINELQSSLDMQQGGPIAEELDRLYTWITTCLLDAVSRKDHRPIDDARKVIETLRSAWQTIATAGPNGSAAPGTRP